MIYPNEDGVVTNFYRTEDGGDAFEPAILPVHKEEWKNCKRVIQFIQDVFAIINPPMLKSKGDFIKDIVT